MNVDIFSWFCRSYDLKPHSVKVLQDIVQSLCNYVQFSFRNSAAVSSGSSSPSEMEPGMAGGSNGGTPSSASSQPGFQYRGSWIPLSFLSAQGTPKSF